MFTGANQNFRMAWRAYLYPLVLVAALLAIPPAPILAQAGQFISIDCGATNPYTDPVTGINWVTDANFTSVGTNVNVNGSTAYPNNGEYTTLRYFNEPRKKYCYTLPVTQNVTYLLRISFWYGNYDKLNKPPKFKMAVGSTEMLDVDLTAANPYLPEYLGRTNVIDTTLSVCFYPDPAILLNPFVSSIELRMLDQAYTESSWLVDGNFRFTVLRQNFGATHVVRYPDDVLDRVWVPWPIDGTVTVSATGPVTNPFGYYLKPPPLVMGTAIAPPAVGPLVLPYKYGFGTVPVNCIPYLYFAELNPNSTVSSRLFTVSIPGPYVGTPLLINIFNKSHGYDKSLVYLWRNMTITDTSVITLAPFTGTIDPPIISAAEIYSEYPPAAVPTYSGDAAAIEAIKVALQLTSWGGDPCLPVPIDWIGCSSASPPRVISVKLANYNLTGQIPSDFGNLTALTSLHLENNDLSGSIPASLATLSGLTELILYNNNLTGPLPAGLNRTGLLLDIRGNPLCNCGRVDSPPSSSNSSSSKSNVGIIAGVVGGVLGVLLVVALGVLIFCVCRKRPRKDDGVELPLSHGSAGTNGVNVLPMDPSPQVAKPFSLAEITAATQNFNRKIGEGGFGPVYYGKLPSGKEVAVKVSDANSRQGVNEFNNEVQLLSRVHHRNLVSLLGYCQDGKNQMLVYEYLPRGTVREHLYLSPLATEEPLDWKTRLDIALDSAQGLEYLHSGCTPPIIHRDVKSSNILLTDKYVAKVADFGLSKLGPEEGDPASHVSTMVKGTAGYLDPEYWSTNNLTERSDVFSFGVVLLELLCGRQPIDNFLADKGDWNLTDKVRRSLQAGDIDSILDPAVKRCHANIDSVWKVAEIAIQSVEPKGMHRPYMRDVVKELREAIELESGQSGVSTYYTNASSTQFAAPRDGWQSSGPDYSNASLDSTNFSETYKQGPLVR